MNYKIKKNRSKRNINNESCQCTTEPLKETSYLEKHKRKNRKKFT